MPTTLRPMILIVLAATLGCDSSDSRLVNMAERHATQQAQQSEKVVELQHEVAEGSRKLVEADAQARQELVAMQHEVRQDQAHVDQQRDALETERRAIATARQRDPIVAAAILDTGLVLACLLPLAVAVYALWAARRTDETDHAVVELLVEEITTEQPRLLGGPVGETLGEPACQPELPNRADANAHSA